MPILPPRDMLGLCAKCQNNLQLNTIYLIPSNLCTKLVEVAHAFIFDFSFTHKQLVKADSSERNNTIVLVVGVGCVNKCAHL